MQMGKVKSSYSSLLPDVVLFVERLDSSVFYMASYKMEELLYDAEQSLRVKSRRFQRPRCEKMPRNKNGRLSRQCLFRPAADGNANMNYYSLYGHESIHFSVE